MAAEPTPGNRRPRSGPPDEPEETTLGDRDLTGTEAVPAVIDAHVHVIVPELLGDRGSPDWRPSVWWQDEQQIVEFDGRRIHSAVGEFVNIDAILASRAKVGIDRVLLCPWVPLLYANAEPKAALDRCRLQNGALARLVAAQAGQVAALGAVPLQAPELAAAELEAVLGSGLVGVEVSTSVSGDYIGDRRFDPFWDAAEATGALVFIHPTTRGFQDPVFDQHYLWNTVGNPFETTICAAQLVMAGVMERHPALRVLLAHGGGALLALRGRLDHAARVQAGASAAFREPTVASISRFHFDSVTHHPGLLRDLVDVVGAERVVLGSDHPFEMADPDPVTTVRLAGLAPADQMAVLGGNAERLLGLATSSKDSRVAPAHPNH